MFPDDKAQITKSFSGEILTTKDITSKVYRWPFQLGNQFLHQNIIEQTKSITIRNKFPIKNRRLNLNLFDASPR